jgi:hypothetical protein
VTRRKRLGRRHAVYELGPGLLLVFKPRGHLEMEHAHDYNQRVRVLRGKLEIRFGARRVVLAETRASLTIRSAKPHATRALADTWLVAERMRGEERS